MKINRYKKLTRRLGFYINNYNFRLPYQLLIDGTFCFAALNNKINIQDNMPRYLQGELKLITTQCVLIETENLGSSVLGALTILKQYVIHKCGHEGKPIPASKCLLSMVKGGNEQHYIVASQDRDLQDKVRRMPGVPLLFLHNKAPVLDPPSEASQQHAKELMNKKYGVQTFEKDVVDKLEEISSANRKTIKKCKKKHKKRRSKKSS